MNLSFHVVKYFFCFHNPNVCQLYTKRPKQSQEENLRDSRSDGGSSMTFYPCIDWRKGKWGEKTKQVTTYPEHRLRICDTKMNIAGRKPISCVYSPFGILYREGKRKSIRTRWVVDAAGAEEKGWINKSWRFLSLSLTCSRIPADDSDSREWRTK